jgi:GlpG protein
MDDAARRGQVWRLVTSALPHGGFLHLAFNLYWLWVFGTALEEAFGPLRTAAVFLLLAAGSQAAEFAFLHGGVGLSGVGYGLFGLLWVLAHNDERFWDVVDSQTALVFVAWFFVCILLTVTQVMPVGNVAHGVGAVLGYLLGCAVVADGRQRLAYAGLTTGAVALSLLAASVGRPYVNLAGRGGESRPVAGQRLAYLGYRELEARRDEAAADYFRKALALDPSQASWWYNLGVAYTRLDREEEALDAFEHALGADPESGVYRGTVVRWLGYLAARRAAEGRHDDAVRLYRRALSFDGKNAPLWFGLGAAYEELGQTRQARGAYDRAAGIDPANAGFRAARDRLPPGPAEKP